MTVPSYNELLHDLPTRSEGAGPSARAAFANLPSSLLAALDATLPRTAALEQQLWFWVRNNDLIKTYERDLTQYGRAHALAALSQALAPKAAHAPAGQSASVLANMVSVHAAIPAALAQSWASAPTHFIGTLARGGAMTTREFDETFFEGAALTWPSAMATTVETQFVPLHFARKNWLWLQGQGPGRGYAAADLTAYVLEIAFDAAKGVTGHWVARIKSGSTATDYDWQGEIIVAPGLNLEVTEVKDEPLAAGWGRLCRVKARAV